MNDSLAYRIGFHPREEAEEQPSITDRFSALLDREESGRRPPYGPVLDVGTGSGIWGIKLAQLGWRVTGVDIVAGALGRAHVRVREAGVDMRLVQGDVTELRATDVAALEATVLLLAWTSRCRGPLPRGVGRSEIEAAFPGWDVTDAGIRFRGAEARRAADEARGALVQAPPQAMA